MESKNTFVKWLNWHFNEMPNFLISAWSNYIRFAADYFSLPILLKTFFAPWRKYKWKYPKSFDIGGILNTFISNLFSRVLGALMRIALIALGLFFQFIVLFVGAIVFVFWFFLPILALAGIIFSIIY